MSWHRPEQRPIVDWPEGRDWRCTVDGCGYVRPEAEGQAPGSLNYGCDECGGPLSRIVVQL